MAIPALALDSTLAPASREEAVRPEVPAEVAIADVLALVRQDRQRTPEAYLAETVTPHGGE